jgi:hypothetical protein
VRSSRRERIRFGGAQYTLLYPAKPFPVSSFSLWHKYIVWSEALDALPEDQRQAIMLHETAHLLHKDTSLGIFLELIKSVWWLNPVFYYIRAELNLISEILADQYTVAHTGDAKSYAVLLVSMKEKQINTLARQLGGSILKHRVVQLLDPKETKAPRGFKLYLLFTGALLWAVSVFAVPAIENHVRLIKEYEILQHEHAKRLAVFGNFYSIDIYTNNAHTMLFPNAHFVAFDAQVQGCLPAHSWQNGIYLMVFENFDDAFWF